MNFSLRIILTLCLTSSFALVFLISQANAKKPLPPLNIDIEHITVSGLSSGGFMANQFHIAHSQWVSGAAIISAGPYFCAQSSIGTALTQCVNKVETPIPLESLNKKAIEYEKLGLIDALSNLKTSRVWLFHGSLDNRVIAPVTQALFEQYTAWVEPQSIQFIQDKPFAHHFPTMASGHECSVSQAPFLGNCKYDAAEQLLTFLLGELDKPAVGDQGTIVEFDQHHVGESPAETLAPTGYAFIPEACSQGSECQIHINFHGCNQNAQSVGTQYIEGNGLNRWAAANQIVVLYPQTTSSMILPLNPQGCWDWWGYTDENYATKQGKQIQAVANIVQAMAASKGQ